MRELTKEDLLKNRIDTIPQYYVLDYLKKNLNIDEFKIYIVNRDTLKVVDKEDSYLYFSYDEDLKEVSYREEVKEKLKDELEIRL